MNVQLDAELVMELRADCPEEDRLVVGGNDWGYLKVIQIKGGHFEGEKLRGRVVPGGADWNMGVGGDTEDTVWHPDMTMRQTTRLRSRQFCGFRAADTVDAIRT